MSCSPGVVSPGLGVNSPRVFSRFVGGSKRSLFLLDLFLISHIDPEKAKSSNKACWSIICQSINKTFYSVTRTHVAAYTHALKLIEVTTRGFAALQFWSYEGRFFFFAIKNITCDQASVVSFQSPLSFYVYDKAYKTQHFTFNVNGNAKIHYMFL